MYYSEQQFIDKLRITVEELQALQDKAGILGTEKNGRLFYSDSDLYHVSGILYFIRQKQMSLEDACREMTKQAVAHGNIDPIEE